MNWKYSIKIRHLFTRKEDHKSIQTSMKKIANELKKHQCFDSFNTKNFYTIPKGDKFFSPSEYANKLLDNMYDYADENKIWIS